MHATDGRPGTGTGRTPGARNGASQRHDPIPGGAGEAEAVNIVVTSDDGEAAATYLGEPQGEEGNGKTEEVPAYAANIDEEWRISSDNVLPSRKTKRLLQLMWLGPEDKVLVGFHSTPLTIYGQFCTATPKTRPCNSS